MSEKHTRWCPDVCPITGRPFFMWIEHHKTGEQVPTYGGPFDSYTIPEKDDDGDYCCERYDHDEGGWLVDSLEDVGVQIVCSQLYTSEDDPAEIMQQRDQLAAALSATVEQRDRLLAALKEYIAAADNSMNPEGGDDVAAMIRFGVADEEARAAIAAIAKEKAE